MNTLDSDSKELTELVLIRSELQNTKWTREYNKGPAFTLPEYARLWNIPERTVRHYAKINYLPDLIKVGKRLKVKRTKKTFNFGLDHLLRIYNRWVRNITSPNSFLPTFWANMESNTRSMVYLQNAHDQKFMSEEDIDSELENLIFNRAAAFLHLDIDDPILYRERLLHFNPDDPCLKMANHEKDFLLNHPKHFKWLSIAAYLAQNGIRPTRQLIAKRLGMSRATFSRLYPEAKWANIKKAIAVLLNGSDPITNL